MHLKIVCLDHFDTYVAENSLIYTLRSYSIITTKHQMRSLRLQSVGPPACFDLLVGGCTLGKRLPNGRTPASPGFYVVADPHS
jgi:hypothetical protein